MSVVLDTLYIGDSRAISIAVVESSGGAVDITGMTATLTIAHAKQGTPVIEIINTVHSNPAQGQSVFQIADTDTISLTPANYHFDIVLDGGIYANYTLAIGTIKISERVSIPV